MRITVAQKVETDALCCVFSDISVVSQRARNRFSDHHDPLTRLPKPAYAGRALTKRGLVRGKAPRTAPWG